jgi:hypothetical protein
MSEDFYQRTLNVPEGLIDYYCDVITTAQKNTIAQNVTDTRPILTVNYMIVVGGNTNARTLTSGS